MQVQMQIRMQIQGVHMQIGVQIQMQIPERSIAQLRWSSCSMRLHTWH